MGIVSFSNRCNKIVVLVVKGQVGIVHCAGVTKICAIDRQAVGRNLLCGKLLLLRSLLPTHCFTSFSKEMWLQLHTKCINVSFIL